MCTFIKVIKIIKLFIHGLCWILFYAFTYWLLTGTSRRALLTCVIACSYILLFEIC